MDFARFFWMQIQGDISVLKFYDVTIIASDFG